MTYNYLCHFDEQEMGASQDVRRKLIDLHGPLFAYIGFLPTPDHCTHSSK